MSFSLGYVVLAHRKLEQAERLLRAIYDPRDVFVVHLDAKLTKPVVDEFRARLADLPEVEVFSELACSWGGYSFTEATLRALGRLLAREVAYCIVLSGADYPCRPRSELVQLLSTANGRNFVEVWWQGSKAAVPEKFRNRYAAYWPFERLVRSNRTRKRSLALQRLARIDRDLPSGLEPVFGSNWMAITSSAARGLLAAAGQPGLARFFRRTALAEEMMPHMLLKRIGALDGNNVGSLHYIATDVDGTFPKLLQAPDLPAIVGSGAFFCRKIELGRDLRLCDHLDDRLSNYSSTEQSGKPAGQAADRLSPRD